MKVHGPYLRKDGRKHVVIIHDEGKRQTQSYPRFLMEQHLGRELLKDEEVDHIDNDFTNNSLDNLQLLSKLENIRKSRTTPVGEYVCLECNSQFFRKEANRRKNKKASKFGPFCTKKCAGTFSARRQYKE